MNMHLGESSGESETVLIGRQLCVSIRTARQDTFPEPLCWPFWSLALWLSGQCTTDSGLRIKSGRTDCLLEVLFFRPQQLWVTDQLEIIPIPAVPNFWVGGGALGWISPSWEPDASIRWWACAECFSGGKLPAWGSPCWLPNWHIQDDARFSLGPTFAFSIFVGLTHCRLIWLL